MNSSPEWSVLKLTLYTLHQIAKIAFLHTGQACFCIKRIYVHERIYDDFLKAFVEHVKGFKTGSSTDAGATHGPVQNSVQHAKLLDMYGHLSEQGYKFALGGPSSESEFARDKKDEDDGGSGFFLPAAVIDNPPEDSRIVVEEQFGPVVPLLKWSDDEDVIKRANASLMGLGGSVWSADLVAAERMTRRLEAGTVWVNTHFDVGPGVAFGGHKNSGIGVESGVDGLKGWCDPQVVRIAKK